MDRIALALVICLLFASPAWAGELRTGRGVRAFSISAKDRKAEPATGRTTRPSPRVRQVSTRSATPVGVAHLDESTEPDVASIVDESFSGVADCRGCGQCDGCGNYWVESEFLLWWRRGRAMPALAATGILPAGNILYGGETAGDNARPGARFELGGFLDYDHCDAIVGRVWALGASQERFDSRDLDAATSVVRPFFDVDPTSPAFNAQNALPIHNIGGSTGHMQVASDSIVWGADFLWKHNYYRTPTSRGDILFGYHASKVDEDVAITHTFTNGGIDVFGRDIFDAKNEFHGVVLGLQVVSYDGPWKIDILGKVAMGDMHQRIDISGFETLTAGGSQTFNGSLLALPTNIGAYERNKFAVVPELNIKSGCQIAPNVEISVGYSFVYWSDVISAADAIDTMVNGSQTTGGALNGSARPALNLQDGTFWVHGVNAGLTWTF